MSIHTAVRPNRRSESPGDRRTSWLLVPAGAAAGLTLGVIARIWMRWISTDPEFTWSGTIAILASFVVFGAAQSAAAVARLRPIRPAGISVLRVLAVVLSIGLFGAAGAVMLPTVLFGSLALWRSDRGKAVRLVFSALALPGVVLVSATISDDHGWNMTTLGRIALFLCIYAAVIVATWPSAAPRPGARRSERHRPWRPHHAPR